MHYSDHLTQSGRKTHQKSLDLTKLKLSHIKHRLTSYDPTYANVMMLINLENKRYKTAILDVKQGLVAVTLSPKQLLKKMTKQHQIMTHWFMRHMAFHLGIREYVPYVYGGLNFSPLKTAKNGTQSWLNTMKIEGMQEHTNFHCVKLWFKECEHPLIIPATQNFILERRKDANLIQRGHDSLLAQMSLANSGEFHDSYSRLKFGNFQESPLELFEFIKEAIIRKSFKFAGFEYTEDDVKELVSQLID
ncbi:hypothetical protein YK48G_21970 [Lentilactobacillus fungorum]|uniref:Uncharacterized protein n=1 Tax=Lentilactobacillus fungorum TaxID=2201250 RepID=A0ABQ3W2S5_9LACO|nr:hypothetical protein [Lentilactobacillus fungorum]GHP14772.1 hypothetical protein YK48G_21970 [Lentilactobacillus fungorum]